MSSPNIMIATPTQGHVATPYMKTIIATMNDLALNGIHARFDTTEDSDLPKQRNVLATRFYESDCTHIFFVDSDMAFSANVCRLMLERAKPIIGTVTQTKSLDHRRVAEALRRGLSFEEALTFGSDWVCTIPEDRDIVVENGLMEVDYLGFGAVLISRLVFDTLIRQGGVQRQHLTKPAWGPFYNFFTLREQAARANQSVSEDITFCDRWRLDCGGKLWALVDVPIYHIGDYAYGGPFIDNLRAVKRLREMAPGTG
jgi:hypothetical protein